MEPVGYLLAILMGFILGSFGGGGSILTVPILVYFFGIPAALATGYSLLIVGSTSLVGAIKYIKEGLVSFRKGFLFAIPSTMGVLIARKTILPTLPNTFQVSSLSFSKDQLILLVFAGLIFLITAMLLRNNSQAPHQQSQKEIHEITVTIIGLVTGIVTGFVGAGGGFIIVPILNLALKLPLRKAIATSLSIISVSTLIGFAGDLSEGIVYHWSFISIFISLTLLGVLIGTWANKKIPTQHLQTVFTYFIPLMGIYIIVKEFIL